MRRSKLLMAVMLTAGFALITAGTMAAQTKKEDPNVRSVEGTVVDADQKPVARAVVYLTDTRTMDIRSFTSAPDGSYHFSGLRNDTDYEVIAKAGDLKSDSKRLTVFDSRKTARIILTLKK